LSAEWLKINKELAYKKIIAGNNVNKLRGLKMYFYRVKCRWENDICNQGKRMEDDWCGRKPV
jgi:hypothetical protein